MKAHNVLFTAQVFLAFFSPVLDQPNFFGGKIIGNTCIWDPILTYREGEDYLDFGKLGLGMGILWAEPILRVKGS